MDPKAMRVKKNRMSLSNKMLNLNLKRRRVKRVKISSQKVIYDSKNRWKR
jgi:hypothetical protein